MNTHTGAKRAPLTALTPRRWPLSAFLCGAPECKSVFAAHSNMLRHRRTHGEIAAALRQLEEEQAAARPPPPPVFQPPIVNQQIGEDSFRPLNVQWMLPNHATRPYRRYPDIPGVAYDAAVPTIAPTMPGQGNPYIPLAWQPVTHSYTGAGYDLQADPERE